jgi:hypothetical protein
MARRRALVFAQIRTWVAMACWSCEHPAWIDGFVVVNQSVAQAVAACLQKRVGVGLRLDVEPLHQQMLEQIAGGLPT